LQRLIHYVSIACLIIGVAGRFYLININTESNDDHAEVVERILANKTISDKDSCWECFQPPLFYKIHASIARLLGNKTKSGIHSQMQFGNVLLSLLTLWLLYLFLRDFSPGSPKLNGLILSFWLVNPAFFGISVQATNDVTIIALGALATYTLLRFLKRPQYAKLLLLLLTAFVAPHFKGSGIALFLLISGALILTSFKIKTYRVATYTGILIASALLVFNSHYTRNYEKYGDPFTINQIKTGSPPLFDNGQEFWKRPGITSVWSSYFKTRFGSLLREPYNINSGDEYPIHRTSFWAQMYGSFYHAQFLQHPETWQNKHPDLLNIVRVTFILGLIPLLVFIIGVGLGIGKAFKSFRNQGNWHIHLVHVTLLLGYLAFNIKYSYDYRDFGCIKSIFMLPALLSITYFIIHGLESLKGRLRLVGTIGFILINILCIVNLLFLLTDLSQHYFG
jgi:hypothetical protein